MVVVIKRKKYVNQGFVAGRKDDTSAYTIDAVAKMGGDPFTKGLRTLLFCLWAVACEGKER